MPYDPNDLNESAESSETEDPTETVEITSITETTAGAVYPDHVDVDDPTKPMIRVEAKTSDGVPVEETFALPQSDLAWHNPNFQLGQFRDTYGKVPEEGMEVEVAMDEESGLLSIKY